jgi:hypothetical protein
MLGGRAALILPAAKPHTRAHGSRLQESSALRSCVR